MIRKLKKLDGNLRGMKFKDVFNIQKLKKLGDNFRRMKFKGNVSVKNSKRRESILNLV